MEPHLGAPLNFPFFISIWEPADQEAQENQRRRGVINRVSNSRK